jgi:uncharacterized damage-inducible protein DinB
MEDIMEQYTFSILAKYNKEANEKMNNIIKTLSEEEWNKTFNGYFKSIHELCSHIYIADYGMLNSFKSINNFRSLNDGYFNKKYTYQETLFEDIIEYLTKRTELDNIIIDFVNEITESDLNKKMKRTNSKGIIFEKKIEVYLMHILNHETHHRGMISLYLEMLGKENDFSGLMDKI